MATYWWYLLKVSICIIVFYSFYMLILRKCTFFLLNRLYLVGGLLLSFIIPILDFSIFKGQSNNVFTNIVYPFIIEPEYNFFPPQNNISNDATVNFSMILPIVYLIGISVLFFKLLFSIVRIIRISNNSEGYRIGQKKIFRMDSNQPFSFFNMIFLPKNENDQMIIEHEMAHVRQYHWFDLILVEIVSVLLWFNPFIFLYKKSLKLQHEYLADTSVIKNRNQIEDYLNCMLRHIQVVSCDGIVSQFYCKTIKKRIVMITKNKTSNKYLGLYLLVLPLICIMLFACSSSKAESAPDSGIVQNTPVVQQPSIFPIDSKKVTNIADYGERTNPISKKKDFHYGIDFAIPEGEKIVSTAEGVVVKTKFNPAKGNYVFIKHNDVFSTFYSHLQSISVEVGDKVEKGQTIGYSGNTGSATTGPHLHYEVLKNGERVNPKDYLPR